MLAIEAAPDREIESGGRRFRADLEGLRGVAILLVVAYHVRLGPVRGGYVGVDVFFVLSGFLITGILVREVRSDGRIGFWAFYARRLRRLLPALVVMVLGSLVLGALVGSPIDLDGWVRTSRAVPAFLTNFVFASEATNYLGDGGSRNLFLHTWTLAVEEQFYLVWPALLAVAVWIGGRRDRALSAAIGLTIVASGAVSLYQTVHSSERAFFGPFSRFWEFGIGAIIVLLPARLAPGRVVGIGTATVGLLAIVYAAVTFSGMTAFPGTAALVPVLGTALVVYSGTGDAAAFRNRFLELGPVRWIGKRSYSWYLWHWPAIVLVVVLYPQGGPKGKLLVAVLSLGIADLSFRFAETPTRHDPRLVADPKRTVAIGVAVIVIGTLLLSGLGIVTGHRATTGRAGRYRTAADDIPAAFDDGCLAGFDATRPKPLGSCAYGDLGSDRVIAVIGDSHAAQWIPAFDRLGKEHGLRIQLFAQSSCPAADVVVSAPAFHRRYRECEQFRRRSIEAIDELRPAGVVMASYRAYVTDGIEGVSASDWREGTARSVRALQRSGAAVTILNDVPSGRIGIPTCLERRTAIIRLSFGDCGIPRSDAGGAQVAAAERAAARTTGARAADPTAAVCPEPRCQAIRNGIITYFDYSHLSATYARSLSPWLQRAISIHRTG